MGLVLLLIAGTWVLMWYLPTHGVCRFREVWLLKALWFQNLTASNQMIGLHYSDADQCVFFAVRSMHSLYFAISTAALLYVFRFNRTKPKGNRTMAAISVLLVVGMVFLDGFNDHAQGYRAWAAYRTDDSVNILIAKSLIRISTFYTVLLIWLLTAISCYNRSSFAAKRPL